MRNSKHNLSGIFLFLLFLSSGCAAGKSTPAIFWPSPPDEPKIAFVQSLRGVSDMTEPGIFDVLFGKDARPDLSKPYGVFAEGSNIYVSDTASSQVAVLDTGKRTIRFIKGDAVEPIYIPIGVAVDSRGTVFVSDVSRKKVIGYNENGEVRVILGKKGDFVKPAGLAIDGERERIYVADTRADTVHAYTLSGERLFTLGKPGVGDGEFHAPTNVAVDRANGNILIVDTNNFRVQIFDKDGKFIKMLGELGDVPGTFSRPKGIGVDSDGNIYVVDAAFDNIQVFNREGRILTSLGRAGTAPGTFSLPAGLYVDESDKIYVVDQLNKRVQVFQYFSEKWKKEYPEEYQRQLSRWEEARKKAEQEAADPDAKRKKK